MPRSPRRTYSWCTARASSEVIVAIRSMASVSKVAAMPMACGKTVVFMLVRATPCRASFHQL